MTIDEAIELQTQLERLLPEVGFNKYLVSNRLGIESLKRVRNLRNTIMLSSNALLPGETKK